MTSVLVMRNFTGVSAGTCAQFGTKEYCSPIILTVTEPSGSPAVPRLLSANSPPRCRVMGSMVSTLLGGCSAWRAPVTTMIAIITPSIDRTTVNHRSSVRATGSRCVIGLVPVSANGPSRNEQHEIEQKPADEEQPYGNAGKDEGATWSVFQRLGGGPCVDWRSHIFYFVGGRHMVFKGAVGERPGLCPGSGCRARFDHITRHQCHPIVRPPADPHFGPAGSRLQPRRSLDRRAPWQRAPWFRDCLCGIRASTFGAGARCRSRIVRRGREGSGADLRLQRHGSRRSREFLSLRCPSRRVAFPSSRGQGSHPPAVGTESRGLHNS